MAYRSSYEVDLDVGFALLEQMEDEEGAVFFESDPQEDQLANVMLTGVHGGGVDPDRPQSFYIYTIDWPDELRDEYDEAVLEGLSAELDSLFPGWVVDKDEDKVYVLRDPAGPDYSDVR